MINPQFLLNTHTPVKIKYSHVGTPSIFKHIIGIFIRSFTLTLTEFKQYEFVVYTRQTLII